MDGLSGFTSGLAGTVGVTTYDSYGAIATPRRTVGISEIPAGSGTYVTTVLVPPAPGWFAMMTVGLPGMNRFRWLWNTRASRSELPPGA